MSLLDRPDTLLRKDRTRQPSKKTDARQSKCQTRPPHRRDTRVILSHRFDFHGRRSTASLHAKGRRKYLGRSMHLDGRSSSCRGPIFLSSTSCQQRKVDSLLCNLLRSIKLQMKGRRGLAGLTGAPSCLPRHCNLIRRRGQMRVFREILDLSQRAFGAGQEGIQTEDMQSLVVE